MNSRSQFVLATLVSVCLHALLLVGLAIGWERTSDPTPRVFKPRYVEAKLVQLKAQDTQAPAQKKNNVIDLTKKRELERQRAEAEKRAKEEAARQRRIERERKARAEAKKREEAERKKQQELEARRRAEEAAKARAEQQRIAQERLDEALRKEEQQRQAELAAQQTQSYVNMISSRIEQNWSRPPSARRGMQVELLIQLVPTGQVVDVAIIRSSGNAAFDRSAEQAVRRVDRFTELRDMPPELFERNFRQLKLVFNPKDLRL